MWYLASATLAAGITHDPNTPTLNQSSKGLKASSIADGVPPFGLVQNTSVLDLSPQV